MPAFLECKLEIFAVLRDLVQPPLDNTGVLVVFSHLSQSNHLVNLLILTDTLRL